MVIPPGDPTRLLKGYREICAFTRGSKAQLIRDRRRDAFPIFNWSGGRVISHPDWILRWFVAREQILAKRAASMPQRPPDVA